jgi:arylsulfatase
MKWHFQSSAPLEKGDHAIFYQKWMADRMFTLVPAQAIVAEFLKTFQEYPPRQKPSSFSIDDALEKARQSQKQLEGLTGGGPK